MYNMVKQEVQVNMKYTIAKYLVSHGQTAGHTRLLASVTRWLYHLSLIAIIATLSVLCSTNLKALHKLTEVYIACEIHTQGDTLHRAFSSSIYLFK